MSRIDRRKWDKGNPFKLRGRGGLIDAFDDAIKATFRIFDHEYNDLCDGTPEELDLLVNETPTFAEKRKVIEFLNKYIDYSQDFAEAHKWISTKMPSPSNSSLSLLNNSR